MLARTNRSLTGREVARLVGRPSHMGVRNALIRLTEHGLVDRQEAGNALLFTLNREHLAAPAVLVLADMRAKLIRRLQATFEGWDLPSVHASMFGSAARGDGDTQSDIDLFIVRPGHVHVDDTAWREQMDGLSANVHRWTGNRAGIIEVGGMEIPRLRDENPRVMQNLRREAVLLYGVDVAELLGAQS